MHHPSIQDTIDFVRPYFEPNLDHGGDSFFNHLTRVAAGVKGLGEQYEHAAWMHDLIEDTPITIEDLDEMGYHFDIITAVELLTKQKGEKYSDYIDRLIASGNKIALAVKISDQQDNTNPKRFAVLPHFMRGALQKRYAGVMPRLLEAAGKVF